MAHRRAIQACIEALISGPGITDYTVIDCGRMPNLIFGFADFTVLATANRSAAELRFLNQFDHVLLADDAVATASYQIRKIQIELNELARRFIVVVASFEQFIEAINLCGNEAVILLCRDIEDESFVEIPEFETVERCTILFFETEARLGAILAYTPDDEYVVALSTKLPTVQKFDIDDTLARRLPLHRMSYALSLGTLGAPGSYFQWIDKVPRRGFYAAESTGDYRYAWSKPGSSVGVLFWGDGRSIKQVRVSIGSASSKKAFVELQAALNGVTIATTKETWSENSGRFFIDVSGVIDLGCISLSSGEYKNIGGRMLGVCVDKIEIIYE